MTKTDFLHKAALNFASNSALVKEEFTTEYCTKLITQMAAELTDRVEEVANFETEYQL